MQAAEVGDELDPCACRELDSTVPMMQPTEDRERGDLAVPFNRAARGRILAQR